MDNALALGASRGVVPTVVHWIHREGKFTCIVDMLEMYLHYISEFVVFTSLAGCDTWRFC